MTGNILKIISFNLSGKFAHFRKFYTNSSSLSYLIPSRTAIIGMLASILEKGRDEYYKDFDISEVKISLKIKKGCRIKKEMQTINYLHEEYPPFLENLFFQLKKKKKVKFHKPRIIELLSNENIKNKIEYQIFVGAYNQKSLLTLNKIVGKIQKQNFGYGIYLGQRQFKAYIDDINVYEKSDIEKVDSSSYLDSIISVKNANPDFNTDDIQVATEQMPINMEKVFVEDKNKEQIYDGRKLKEIKRILFERNGKRITGKFDNCYKINDKVISFFED